GSAPRTPRTHELPRLAVDHQVRAEGEEFLRFARGLAHERAVEPERLPDTPEDDELGAAHVPAGRNRAVASSRVGACKRFSAANDCARGHALRRVSATARSTSKVVRRKSASWSSTAQKAATSPSYGMPTLP